MSKQIFPKEFLNAAIEHYTFNIGRTSSTIYVILILLVLFVLIAFPLITVDIYISANGYIDSNERRYTLFSPVSGVIIFSRLIENEIISENKPLIRFDQSVIDAELEIIRVRLQDIESFIHDLLILIENQSNVDHSQLKTSRYRLAQLQFISTLKKLSLEKKTLETIYLRQKALFEQKVIAASIFEIDEANYVRIQSEIEIFKSEAVNRWKETSLGFDQERNDIILKKEHLLKELNKYSLMAPAEGELQNVTPLKTGQFISSGMKLGEISPTSALIATCWVPSKDIGLLKKEMVGSVRIDAFNYNEWGFINGKISDISTDSYFINNQPLFKVKCELEKNHLTLKNGIEGEFKKGMTLQSNFHVTTRTLYQLLYDKINDWLNPTISTD